jgi:hypothetical protein
VTRLPLDLRCHEPLPPWTCENPASGASWAPAGGPEEGLPSRRTSLGRVEMGGLRDAGEAGGWRTVHTIQEVWPRASAAGVGHTCRAKKSTSP